MPDTQISDNSPKGITQTYDNIDLRKFRGKWRDKKEFNTFQQTYKRIQSHVLGRQTNCPWADPDRPSHESIDGNTVSNNSGTDWEPRWSMDERGTWMYHEYIKGRSNVKSPITWGPYSAFLAEFSESRLTFSFNQSIREDADNVKVMKYLYRDWESVNDIDKVNLSTAREVAEKGSAIRHITWVKKQREVSELLGSEAATKEVHDIMATGTAKEKQALKDRLETQSKPLTKKKVIIDVNDVQHLHIPIRDFYVGPEASEMSTSYHPNNAYDCHWRQVMTLEQARQEFQMSTDPYIIKENIDRIQPSSIASVDSPTITHPTSSQSHIFYKRPVGTFDSDLVEVFRYYNENTDKYLVIVNDIIIRDGPLPFAHKRLPFSLHRLWQRPGQFYGVGYAALLETLQSEDELQRNMAIRMLTLQLNPPRLISKTAFEDYDSQSFEIEAGNEIVASGSVGPDSFRWWEAPKIGYDFSQMRSSFNEDAIKISGINPLAYSIPKPGEPVRNNLMTQESTQKMIKLGIKGWASGYRDAAIQTVSIMRQMYPDQTFKSIDPETGTKKKADDTKIIRTIQVRGMSLETSNTDNKTQITERKLQFGEGSTAPFDVTKDHFDIKGQIDIQIEMDSIVPETTAMKMTNSDRFLKTLTPLMIKREVFDDPRTQALIRYFGEEQGLPAEYMDMLQGRPDEESIRRAMQQDIKLAMGTFVPGIAGESQAHINTHAINLTDMISKEREISKKLQSMDPNTTSASNMQILQGQLQLIGNGITAMQQHMDTDRVPKTSAGNAAIAQAQQATAQPSQPQQGPAMPPQGQPPMGQMPGNQMGQAPMMPPQGQGAPPMMG